MPDLFALHPFEIASQSETISSYEHPEASPDRSSPAAPDRGLAMSTKAKANKPTPGYCLHCSKVAWHTWESAKLRVEELKAIPGVRKPYLLDAYRCPKGAGWHIGHNYKLQWLSLCTGEHK